MILKIKRLSNNPDLPLPEYATKYSSGLDLLACINEPIIIRPFERKLIPTGIAIEVPPGYEAQIRPRSGMALKHGITVLNTPGTIDSDYRGEIGVILINLGQANFTIERGMKIAQMVIAPVYRAVILEKKKLSSSERGENGFGSTGI